MACVKCGCEQVAGAQFCRECGAPQPAWTAPVTGPGAVPLYPILGERTRVRQNLQPLGIMWCLYGAYRLIAGLVAIFALHTMAANGMFGDTPPFALHLMRAMAPVFGLLVFVMAAAAILTGYSLLTARPWARVLAIVMGILSLLKIPIGTALGIYTLWVLAPRNSGDEWQRMTGTRGVKQIPCGNDNKEGAREPKAGTRLLVECSAGRRLLPWNSL